jgi:hypothetical protein
MSNNHDAIARNIFQERIKKGLLGPGSDIFVDEKEVNEEIISDFPLQRYYTGILFPERTRVNTQSEADENDLKNNLLEDQENDIFIQNNESGEENKENQNPSKEKGEDNELRISQNTFFPTNIGLTFCVDNNIKEIDVEFSFGLYHQLNEKQENKLNECKIKFSENLYNEQIKNNEKFPQILKDKFGYKDGYLFLKKKITGNKGGRGQRSEDYVFFDKYKNEFLNRIETQKVEKLLGRKWKRENIIINKTILISEIIKPEIIFDKYITKTKENIFRASYTVKIYNTLKNPNRTYVKIQLVNNSDEHPAGKFSNANEQLNQKSIFQAKIKVQAKNMKPYKSYIELNPLDKESEILNYLYKDKYSYGIGHNCSVTWDNNNNTIETTFLPQYDVKDTKNRLYEEDFINSQDYSNLSESLDIYNLSHFSKENKGQIISKLNKFIDLYGKWIEQQKEKTSVNQEIENSIFKNLYYNFNRLKSNIKLLNNDNIFKAFQIANTAMFIQIIISNDKDFSGKEKDISDLNKNSGYNSIRFFENYLKIEEERLKENSDYKSIAPKYRPFQLAFLLLNIDGITKLESDERNRIVDLIWFPTGGGKTEAYLAVVAFTIIYRRLTNKTGFEGTSVIMRYTLRLLTAQQFERASRLIVTLEFLRNVFHNELRDEHITIGMWVGMSSTPNTIKEAIDKIDDINEECNKKNNRENGYPENKNIFQISSCPWCGTKLITKNKHGKWDYGFKIVGKGKSAEIKIKCLNEHCHFHNVLPIQVVDEMLYKKPPTLLFGTVDKFAMLAWKANGHRFFNSLDNEKLPPDLIIQDELHLLAGPLGSITGIFESVIEILCTKEGRKPKIISSTATTRNTNEQIKALYGNNRKVNIFPPSGLSYNDSFFAKVSKSESKRRYLGFIPTGKSAIDTQLQILANLFVSRLEAYKTLIQEKNDYETFDKYWTIISYYNSLKNVGKIHNKVGDEISNFTSTFQIRLFGDQPEYEFNYTYLNNRDVELTSRVESSKIKQTLKDIEENIFSENTIKKSDKGKTYVTGIIDLVLATNMISVGIDIDRFNIMLINGQPRNIAEYIQASSRVGRKYKGLVIDLLDANRARDKSYFEHFIPFHQAFYKSVEPISLTPFTENTLEKMLASIMITYVRHKILGMSANNEAQNFKSEMLDGLKKEIKERYKQYSKTYELFKKKLRELSDDWIYQIKNNELKNYVKIENKYNNITENGLLSKPYDKHFNESDIWFVMQSMREIDTNSFIKIELPKNKENG